MKLYKLTDNNGQTKYNTQWGEGVTHIAQGAGMELCSDGVLHAYADPLLAVLLNHIHANLDSPQLWEAEGDVIVSDGLKVGCKALTTVKQIPIPELSVEQKIRFAILCAKVICSDSAWNEWADNWLSGKDRTKAAARTAARTATWAAARAAEAAEWTAARAAEAAARTAARTAARAAAEAAEWIARAVPSIDFIALAHAAIEKGE